MIKSYLLTLGLQEKEALLRLASYKLGIQPASVLARHTEIERTVAYKTLLGLVKKGLMRKTTARGVSSFFVVEESILADRVEKEKKKAFMLQESRPTFLARLQQSRQISSLAPAMTLYDGVAGIKNLYDDILREIQKNEYCVITFFTSKTLDSYALTPKTLSDYYQAFFTDLEKQGIRVQIRIGQGISLMENIVYTTALKDILDVPAGNSAINIFVVGQVVYYIVFEEYPAGVKIASKALANGMHFFFEHLQK